ncbi:hypothetical protein BOO25_20135 [Vibrio navarrensis]|uniref:hypothetical protein n=1 Tax=Vibrio navarrensis TaxID=29495 RepID=UPI00192F361A|nr:hypothetical protein [Vibrio navarrensis]MBE3671238.1 hypothetical protein [Vibrio navarrensis]
MLDLNKKIAEIESLLEEGSDASITYAALECRLTIEYICYERFKLFRSYLSPKDIEKWQPKHIVKQVSEDVSDVINHEVIISVASLDGEINELVSQEDYEKLDYKILGTQKSVNLSIAHKLWNSLSGLALHINLPSVDDEAINYYGNADKIKCKVKDALDLFNELKKGDIIIGGFLGETFNIECVSCKILIKKPAIKLKSGKVLVNCISPNCPESYLVNYVNGDYFTERSVFKFKCNDCGHELVVPHQTFSKFRFNSRLETKCENCSSKISLTMQLLAHVERNT